MFDKTPSSTLPKTLIPIVSNRPNIPSGIPGNYLCVISPMRPITSYDNSLSNITSEKFHEF